jgi:tungstate transport system substrate-binding protein
LPNSRSCTSGPTWWRRFPTCARWRLPAWHRLLTCATFGTLLAAALGGAQGRAAGSLVLATTTSTQDTGLLDALTPRFEKQTGITVKVVAVGTGQALELGRRGDADLLLVHAPALEEAFVKQGYGINRRALMYNDFVIVGPARDPAHLKGMKRAADAFRAIARSRAPFASRGDNSGTHLKELEIWKAARIKPESPWHLSSGSGMAATLRLAGEKRAYTLSDRGTFLAQKKNLDLAILVEGNPALFNPYHVITVNPKRFPWVNYAAAQRFVRFLFEPATRDLIRTFGKDKFGQPLFHLSAAGADL